MSAQDVTSHLFDLLQEQFLEDMSEGLWFWLLFMGCVVSEPSLHRLWFLERMAGCCDKGVMEELDFETRLGPYFFLPSRQGARIPAVIEYLSSMVRGQIVEQR